MRKLILLITLLLVVAAAIAPQAQGPSKTILLLPFYDESGYHGPWDLAYEVPEMIGDMIGGADDYFDIVPMDSVRSRLDNPNEKTMLGKFFDLFRNSKRVQKILRDTEILSLGREYGADLVITGMVSDFNFRRTGGGDPMLGGYKSYTSKISINRVRVLRVSDGMTLGTVQAEDSKNTKGLGLELFGKPRQMDLEFYSLDSLDFGSKRFLATMMGQNTVEVLNTIHKEIRTIITRPDSNWYSTKKFKVISIEPGIAMINAGSEDGVSPGDKFNVFTSDSGIRVGKINVLSLWSEHIARTEILEGRDEIRPNDVIMPDM